MQLHEQRMIELCQNVLLSLYLVQVVVHENLVFVLHFDGEQFFACYFGSKVNLSTRSLANELLDGKVSESNTYVLLRKENF